MNDSIVIRITGHPVPQGRPRAVAFAGHARLYKPAKSRRWEEDARQEARLVMGPRTPFKGCLLLDLKSFIVPPTGWAAWKIEAAIAGLIRPTSKPDVSNLLKAAEDALNGVVWIDDAQIVNAGASKHYAEQPEVQIVVTSIDAMPAQIKRKADLAAAT